MNTWIQKWLGTCFMQINRLRQRPRTSVLILVINQWSWQQQQQQQPSSLILACLCFFDMHCVPSPQALRTKMLKESTKMTIKQVGCIECWWPWWVTQLYSTPEKAAQGRCTTSCWAWISTHPTHCRHWETLAPWNPSMTMNLMRL